MKLLLDTHVLIWWLRDVPDLGSRPRALIAQNDTIALFSLVSCWEATVKHRVGKMDMTGSEMWRSAIEAGFEPVGLEAAHIEALEQLPKIERHRDPFDHLLLAQAAVEGAALMTHDRALPQYGVPCIGVR